MCVRSDKRFKKSFKLQRNDSEAGGGGGRGGGGVKSGSLGLARGYKPVVGVGAFLAADQTKSSPSPSHSRRLFLLLIVTAAMRSAHDLADRGERKGTSSVATAPRRKEPVSDRRSH